MNKDVKVILEEIKKDKDVLAVMLFGSSARGTSTKKSDTDICLFLRDSKKSLKKRIQYSSNPKIDVQVFNSLPLYIKVRILKEGKLLSYNDLDAVYKIAIDTIKEFEDYNVYYNNYIESMKNG